MELENGHIDADPMLIRIKERHDQEVRRRRSLTLGTITALCVWIVAGITLHGATWLVTVRLLLVGLLASCVSGSAEDPPGRAKAGIEKEMAGIKFCWCPADQFIMGSPENEPDHRPDEGQVEVTLSKGFWMAKYETTQGQWKRVVGTLPGKPTAELPEGDDLPVGNVNFVEAEKFCAKLTELGRKDRTLLEGWEFRLPTEAQWEYACRAGTKTATSFGDMLSPKQANFKDHPYNGAEDGPAIGKAVKVGSYPANPWGLHDMHGNTFEWCRDWYHAKLPGGVDPDLYDARNGTSRNRDGSISRVRRGGAWTDEGKYCRSALRLRFEPERGYDHIGFRVVAVEP